LFSELFNREAETGIPVLSLQEGSSEMKKVQHYNRQWMLWHTGRAKDRM
jgi:hypothetical protein